MRLKEAKRTPSRITFILSSRPVVPLRRAFLFKMVQAELNYLKERQREGMDPEVNRDLGDEQPESKADAESLIQFPQYTS